ncbi:T9SS type A sorting domain-containing protein [Flavobacteriaceae bacterium]|nr:T9SS type A sorting domain-containing protein [Flavobacteriaceae bacterium]
MKTIYTLIFLIITTSLLTAQTTTNFKSAEGYADGLLSNNTNWGGQFIYVNTTNESVSTQSNTAEAFWGQSQSITEGETITFEVDMKFGGDLGYTANTFIAQIGFNAGGTTSSGGSDRQFIYLKALTNGKLKIERRAGGNLQSTPGYVEGWTIDTWKNQDLTVKVSFLLGNSASTSTVTVRLINRTTGEFTDAAFDQNGIFSTTVYNGAVNGNLYGFFRTLTLQDGDGATTESFSVSRVKLVNEDTLFPDTFTNTSGDNQWATAANWDSGSVPSSYTDVTISSGQAIEAGNTTAALANNITLSSASSLSIDETSSLTVSGDFTNSGTVTLDSTEDDYSSLIVTGTATGNIVYNRYVNSYDTNPGGGGWDLVGAPAGMTIANFTAANAGTLKVIGDDYAFSQYDNALGQWVRYETASQTGSFTAGQGYSMATNAGDGATVAFTGPMQTTSQSINIIDNNDANGGAGRRWNLVSNPFPSYINGNPAAGASNFIDVNIAVIDGNYGAVYGWNGSSYDIYNLLDDAFSIAPGQGFWVAALNTEDTALSFTPDMRTTTGSGDFVAGPMPLTYHVALELYNGESQKATTDFYFRDGFTLGLDPWYDAGAFNQSIKLSSRLPQGSQETAFSKNAMGMEAMQNTRVPLEIRQNAGQAFRVSIADMDLPEDIYVYLEDTVNGTFTSLKDQDFELTALSDLSGVDRFFIVFKSNSVLSNGDTLGIEALNVYKANNNSFVTIAGITPDLGQLDVTIYNVLGMTVREKSSLNPATATQRVSTGGLVSGLYIVQIKSGNQTTVKKVIVK